MEDNEAPLHFEFTTEEQAAYVPLQKLVSVEGYFLHGQHSGKHIAMVPGDYLANRIAFRVGEAIVMQEELNRRNSREIVDRLLAEPDSQQSEEILSDYVHAR